MKQLFYLIVGTLLIISCSSDNNSGGNFSSEGGGQGGSLARFIVVDNYLYTVGDQKLSVFNITDPNTPVYVTETFIGFEIETLFVKDDFLYIGSRLGMYIYDISNREAPQWLSEVSHLRSCDPVVSSGDFTYVTLHTNATCVGTINQLEVYDTTDPRNPVLLHVRAMARPIGLGLYNNYLLVTDQDEVVILDVTNPATPVLIYSIAIDAFDVIIRNDQLIVVGERQLTQYQLNPNDITDIEELSTITY